MIDLSQKIALITGAGSGIGRASAHALASAGVDIVVNDVNAENAASVVKEVETLGRRGVAKVASVADYDAVERMVDEVWGNFGPIDILVNNAGVFIRHDGGTATMPLETWHGILAVNLHGVFHCTRAVLRHMIPRRAGGKIINISSLLSLVAHFETSSYHVSKAGVNMLTRCLAVELAPHKINVNAIGPGAIATEGLGATLSPEIIQAYRNRIPWGARGRPKDIGNVVAFLSSDEARYITGQVIYVDGGYLVDSTPEGIKEYVHPVPPDDPDPL
ncbi:MAG: SDR family oxidoreductase [Candidatus Latescibacteria bacterium]|nr:SDR family oxidoreductase [Candidatus Latescibacterota bacterium]